MFILIELVVWALLCTLLVSNEKGLAAAVVSLVTAGALWLTGINIFMWAWENPVTLGQGLVAYLIAGFVWATFKFTVKLRKARSRYLKDKAKWLEGTDNAPHGQIAQARTEQRWIDKVKSSHYDREDYAPTVNRNKSNILFWAWWWPFSIVAFLFEDLLREIVNISWKAIKAFFEGIRTRLLGQAAKDLD